MVLCEIICDSRNNYNPVSYPSSNRKSIKGKFGDTVPRVVVGKHLDGRIADSMISSTNRCCA